LNADHKTFSTRRRGCGEKEREALPQKERGEKSVSVIEIFHQLICLHLRAALDFEAGIANVCVSADASSLTSAISQAKPFSRKNLPFELTKHLRNM
jgi:hypothetical protein